MVILNRSLDSATNSRRDGVFKENGIFRLPLVGLWLAGFFGLGSHADFDPATASTAHLYAVDDLFPLGVAEVYGIHLDPPTNGMIGTH